MHNLSNGYFQNEMETGDNEYANELLPEFEFNNNEFTGEYANELLPEFEFENDEMEQYETGLAGELQEITNEAEFGAWLKRLGKKAAGSAAGFLNSPTGQQATAALGDIAKKTLPGLGSKAGGWVGGKLGGLVGRADQGRKLGQQYGSKAGQAAAGRYPDFVKFATDTLSNLSQEFEAGATPAIKPAILKSARKYYPVILKVKGTLYARPVRNTYNQEMEYNNEYNNGYNNEFSNENYGETTYEMEGEITDNEATFNEVTEMELASELLSIQSEAELDQFFGKLFKKAVGGIKKFAQSSTGKALGGMLKGLAKTALPIAGKALGTFIAPGIGTAIGGALGTAASNLFELELEGLSAEDREFETARAFVKFAGNSARRASVLRGSNAGSSARAAIISSARRYAPGLIAHRRRPQVYNRYNPGVTVYDHRDNDTVIDHRTDDGDDQTGSDIELAQEGTWHRQGGNIILKAN